MNVRFIRCESSLCKSWVSFQMPWTHGLWGLVWSALGPWKSSFANHKPCCVRATNSAKLSVSYAVCSCEHSQAGEDITLTTHGFLVAEAGTESTDVVIALSYVGFSMAESAATFSAIRSRRGYQARRANGLTLTRQKVQYHLQ